MSIITAPVLGSARVVVLASDPRALRGTDAEFRHFGASPVVRTDIVGALAELVRDPDAVLVVSSDLPCADIADVWELAIATCRSTVLLGLHSAASAGAVDIAVAAGVGGIVDLPLTPERLGAALRSLAPVRAEIPRSVAVGSLTVDRDRHRVEFRGTAVATTPREFDILLALATSHPRIVTLEELAGRYAGGAHPEASIRVMVAGLRTRFAALTGEARDAVIETHRGVGYRLAA